jgi:hypothetical protein
LGRGNRLEIFRLHVEELKAALVQFSGIMEELEEHES